MVAMKYLYQMKSHKAIPFFEKMLESPHSDERDYALMVLEEFAVSAIRTVSKN